MPRGSLELKLERNLSLGVQGMGLRSINKYRIEEAREVKTERHKVQLVSS